MIFTVIRSPCKPIISYLFLFLKHYFPIFFLDKMYILHLGAVGSLLIIFFCFRFPVVLFGSPGFSNYHATIVSVESSSLLLQSIKM